MYGGQIVVGLCAALLAGLVAGTDGRAGELRGGASADAVGRSADALLRPTARVFRGEELRTDRVRAERDRAGTDAWLLQRPARRRQIEGFAHRTSVLPGQQVRLQVSTGARSFRVVAFRFGDYRGGKARRVWSSGRLRGGRQRGPVFRPFRTRTVVAPWQVSARVPTDGWAPGLYVFKLVARTGWQAHVPFVLRSPSARGRVALVSPVTTWQAYNDWGGYSLYRGPSGDRRSWMVSFDRPYPPPGAGLLRFMAMDIVVQAERSGVPLAYFTNVDLAGNTRVLAGARGYVSMGHDEYWSPEMRTAVVRARRGGTNLAFLGANTMYWRIRMADSPSGPRRRVIGYRADATRDPLFARRSPRTTARWRDQPHPRPENAVVGMLYECFPVDAPYRIVSPGWWGFRGTGARRGELFAHLIGVEADRVYPIRSTPRPLQILTHVRYSCGGVSTSAQSVYYTVRSGAGVFTAGTLRWSCSLAAACARTRGMPRKTVAFTRQVTQNLMRGFARGPVGERFPARDNVRRFHLPRRNRVPAS